MVSIGSFGRAVEEAEGEHDTFTFYSHEFQISDRVGAMPVLKFSHAASSGLETSDMEGMAAMYDMIKDCLRPPWEEPILDDDGKPVLDEEGKPKKKLINQMQEFERVATENRSTPDEILEICKAIYTALTSRPTKQASGSVSTPPSTTEKSNKEWQSWPKGLQSVESLSKEEIQTLTG